MEILPPVMPGKEEDIIDDVPKPPTPDKPQNLSEFSNFKEEIDEPPKIEKEIEPKKGFFSKLFGKKEHEEPNLPKITEEPPVEEKIIDETPIEKELEIPVDIPKLDNPELEKEIDELENMGKEIDKKNAQKDVTPLKEKDTKKKLNKAKKVKKIVKPMKKIEPISKKATKPIIKKVKKTKTIEKPKVVQKIVPKVIPKKVEPPKHSIKPTLLDRQAKKETEKLLKELEKTRNRVKIERESLEQVKHKIVKVKEELTKLTKQKNDAIKILEHKEDYFQKEYKKIDKLKDDLAKEREKVHEQLLKLQEKKEAKIDVDKMHEKLQDEIKEERKHKRTISQLVSTEASLNQKIAIKESELSTKEYELNEREKLLEEKSNALLELQNELIKEKHLIEEKRFNKLVDKIEQPKPSPSVKINFSGDQIYHMIDQANDLIETRRFAEAKHLYNLIYENFTNLKIPKEEKTVLELSINNLYNELNLAILNQ